MVHRTMDYEWDQKKSRLNFDKNRVHFSDALSVLEDTRAMSITEESVDGEERSITIGTDLLGVCRNEPDPPGVADALV